MRVGRTSITVHLEAWVVRRKEMQSILVTDGNFTYVSIDEHGHPQPVRPDGVDHDLKLTGRDARSRHGR